MTHTSKMTISKMTERKEFKTRRQLEKYLDATYKGWKTCTDNEVDTVYTVRYQDVAYWDYNNDKAYTI